VNEEAVPYSAELKRNRCRRKVPRDPTIRHSLSPRSSESDPGVPTWKVHLDFHRFAELMPHVRLPLGIENINQTFQDLDDVLLLLQREGDPHVRSAQ